MRPLSLRHTSRTFRPHSMILGLAILLLVQGVAQSILERPTTTESYKHAAQPQGIDNFSYIRLNAPSRTQIRDAVGNTIATFTDGSRSAVLEGSSRTFSEPGLTHATVTTSEWVRLLPSAWQAGNENQQWFRDWFAQTWGDNGPDVLDVAFQYVQNASAMHENGIRFRGDAGFGPLNPETGKRREGADFYDYLGTDWTFPDGTKRRLSPEEIGDVDCSGFARLVYGYRFGVPLHAGDGSNKKSMPRQARAIAEDGPGTLIDHTFGRAITDYSLLHAGDLVFFDTSRAGNAIHHMGIYLGVDNNGGHRFISSRATADGPTMSDVNGTSLLDDGRYYSKGFVAIRRI